MQAFLVRVLTFAPVLLAAVAGGHQLGGPPQAEEAHAHTLTAEDLQRATGLPRAALLGELSMEQAIKVLQLLLTQLKLEAHALVPCVQEWLLVRGEREVQRLCLEGWRARSLS